MTSRLLSTVLLVVLLHAPGAHADDDHGQLAVESWSERDGVPSGSVFAFAQDVEGYLWIGSAGGLLRFDGVHFVRWTDTGIPADRTVRSLLADDDGAIWVGFGDLGGVSRVTRAGSKHYGPADGLRAGAVMGLVRDATGQIWAATEHGLFVRRGHPQSRWFGAGLTDLFVYGAMFDRAGDLYLGTSAGIFLRRASTSALEHVAPLPEGSMVASGDYMVGPFPRTFAETTSGVVLVNDWSTGYRAIFDTAHKPMVRRQGRGYRVLVDREQHLWIGTIGQGLWRTGTRNGSRTTTSEAHIVRELANDSITALFEDRNGSIWVGSIGEISRLSTPRVSRLQHDGVVSAIEVTKDGSVWISGGAEIVRFSSHQPNDAAERISWPGLDVKTVHADARGGIWVVTPRRLVRLDPDKKSRKTGFPLPEHDIDLVADAPGDGLWLYDRQRGLHVWRENSGLSAVPDFPDAPLDVLFTTRAGQLWAASTDATLIVRAADGTFSRLGEEHGWTIGICRAMFEDRDGTMWFAATRGIAKFENGRFRTLTEVGGVSLRNANSLLTDDIGDLWVASVNGIWRLSSSHLATLSGEWGGRGAFDRYTRLDGVAGTHHAFNRNRRAVRAGDNRLWFVTSQGVSILDPRSLRHGDAPAPVRIEYYSTGHSRAVTTPDLQLARGTRHLEIFYSELSLTAPLRTRFRYRLKGADSDWIDAGVQRHAIYTNLEPGSYEFEVSATDRNGSWLPTGATWSFSIAPFFYQTTWFTALVLALVLLAVALLWRLRMGQLQREFSLVLGERLRLSRDIHDTFLQYLVGLSLQFDAVSSQDWHLPPAIQQHLARMRKQLEEHIKEARHELHNLRSISPERRDLVSGLRHIGERTTAGHSATFALHVSGTRRRFSPRAKAELLRIGQEALSNAVRHAHATSIRLRVHYDRSSISMEVSDDGCGFDAKVAESAAEHYGLTSMRERAEDVGGRLEVTSTLGQGTNVRATVPLVPPANDRLDSVRYESRGREGEIAGV